MKQNESYVFITPCIWMTWHKVIYLICLFLHCAWYRRWCQVKPLMSILSKGIDTPCRYQGMLFLSPLSVLERSCLWENSLCLVDVSLFLTKIISMVEYYGIHDKSVRNGVWFDQLELVVWSHQLSKKTLFLSSHRFSCVIFVYTLYFHLKNVQSSNALHSKFSWGFLWMCNKWLFFSVTLPTFNKQNKQETPRNIIKDF